MQTSRTASHHDLKNKEPGEVSLKVGDHTLTFSVKNEIVKKRNNKSPNINQSTVRTKQVNSSPSSRAKKGSNHNRCLGDICTCYISNDQEDKRTMNSDLSTKENRYSGKPTNSDIEENFRHLIKSKIKNSLKQYKKFSHCYCSTDDHSNDNLVDGTEHENYPNKNSSTTSERNRFREKLQIILSDLCTVCSCNRKVQTFNRKNNNEYCKCYTGYPKYRKKECECPKSKRKEMKTTPTKYNICCQCSAVVNQETAMTTETDKQIISKNESTESVDEKRDNSPINNDNDNLNENEGASERKYTSESSNLTTSDSSKITKPRNSSEGPSVKDEMCSCCSCDMIDKKMVDQSAGYTSDSDESISSTNNDLHIYNKNKCRTNEKGLEYYCECDEEIQNSQGHRKSILKATHYRTTTDNYEATRNIEDHSKPNRQKKFDQYTTDNVIDCDCKEFEKLIDEIENYCKMKYTHLENTEIKNNPTNDNGEYNRTERFRSSKLIYLVQNNTKASYLLHRMEYISIMLDDSIMIREQDLGKLRRTRI
ncbi:hypothetical protein HHI36_015095 [Cryptolaemus montrouzieri]|uniref:Uncharacterized protein n=1 Tax=Cryptolaemus montrouzieri TaxID=559131 RepID=A0ABD2N5T4_9CUCU